HTARWRMSDIHGTLLPVPDLTANVRMDDLFFVAGHWDSATVPMHVGDRTVALPRVTLAAGDTALSMVARADWDKSRWKVTADSAGVRSDQFAWTAETPMLLSGDSGGVDFDRLEARDGDARLEI